MPGKSEPARAGLYSYILFGSRPESMGTERWWRYFETLAAFGDLPSASDAARYIDLSLMNITLLPILCNDWELSEGAPQLFRFDADRLLRHKKQHETVPGQPRVHPFERMDSSPDKPGTACILVDNYDYARAQFLLSVLGPAHLEGPYIVSVRSPLSKMSSLPSQYLYQDLSGVPPKLISLWIKEFMAQAQEQEFWVTRTKEQFVLRLRTAIGVAGQQIPSLDDSIHWAFAAITQRPK